MFDLFHHFTGTYAYVCLCETLILHFSAAMKEADTWERPVYIPSSLFTLGPVL